MQTETIVFGGGCFWCTEAVFTMLKGVLSVEPGYAGGTVKNPTYEQVSAGNTGHAEVIKIVYDPDQISFPELLQVFFGSHDATMLNRQGNDVGPQYRSAVFYTTTRQKEQSQHYIKNLDLAAELHPALAIGAGKIVTTIEPLGDTYYPAEDYHKNYFEHHKDAPYCQLIIAPKVEKVEKKFKMLLK
ncbi:MAG TPA: peptide-methionine (S)-S-oxide reductase MsrA [Candidatus Paceibacterota bacterium]